VMPKELKINNQGGKIEGDIETGSQGAVITVEQLPGETLHPAILKTQAQTQGLATVLGYSLGRHPAIANTTLKQAVVEGLTQLSPEAVGTGIGVRHQGLEGILKEGLGLG